MSTPITTHAEAAAPAVAPATTTGATPDPEAERFARFAEAVKALMGPDTYAHYAAIARQLAREGGAQ